MEVAGTTLRLPSQSRVKKRMKWGIFELPGVREMAQWVSTHIALSEDTGWFPAPTADSSRIPAAADLHGYLHAHTS